MNQKKGYKSNYRPEYPADFAFDYKDPLTLSRFLMEAGKIVPARVSKLSHKQQRALNTEVKKARQLALIPQGAFAADQYRFPDQISVKPFEY